MPITIGGDTTPEVPVSSMLGGMVDSFVSKLVGSVKFDWRKIDPVKLKLAVAGMGGAANIAITNVGDALKPAATAPLNADDVFIDKAVALEIQANDAFVSFVTKEIDVLLKPGVFGAEAAPTSADVDAWTDSLVSSAKAEGHAAPQFNAECVSKIKANPGVLRLIKRLSKKTQLRAATMPDILQAIMDFFTNYGPLLSMIFSVLIMFI